MKRLLLIVSFAAFKANCQNQPFLDSVRLDSLRACIPSYAEEKCHVKSICESRNEIEVRLEVFILPTPQYHLYVLTKNDARLSAIGYFRTKRWHNNISETILDSTILTVPMEIGNLFALLEHNNYTALPDQEGLSSNYYVDDGEIYTLTYKIGKSFRRYTFNNPGVFAEKFKEVQEYKNYYNIATAFYKTFSKR